METTNNTGTLVIPRTKKETIELVKNSYPSIWSKDDVLSLLNQLEDVKNQENDEPKTDWTTVVSDMIDNKLDKLKGRLQDSIENLYSSDIVDYSSAEFELDGNVISLREININNDSINDVIDDVVEHYSNEIKSDIGVE